MESAPPGEVVVRERQFLWGGSALSVWARWFWVQRTEKKSHTVRKMTGKPYSQVTVQSREDCTVQRDSSHGKEGTPRPWLWLRASFNGVQQKEFVCQGCSLVGSDRASEATPCAPSHNALDSNPMHAQLHISVRWEMGYSSQKFPQRTLFMCSKLVQAGLASLLSYWKWSGIGLVWESLRGGYYSIAWEACECGVKQAGSKVAVQSEVSIALPMQVLGCKVHPRT